MQCKETCLTSVQRCMFPVGTLSTLHQHYHCHNLPLHVSMAGHDDHATVAYFTSVALGIGAVEQYFQLQVHAGTTLAVLALTTANIPESKHQMMAFNHLQARSNVAIEHSWATGLSTYACISKQPAKALQQCLEPAATHAALPRSVRRVKTSSYNSL